MVARKTALIVGCLALLAAVAADSKAEGNLALTRDWRVQQFFYSAEPSDMTLMVTATEGSLLIYTRNGNGSDKELGRAAPGSPLRVSGSYTVLVAKLPEKGTEAKGTFKLTFAHARVS